MKITSLKLYIKQNQISLEAIMWIGALLYLLTIDPYAVRHFSFCLFYNLGIDFCPGCGIGRSIAMLYHGDIVNSFLMHPLGGFALTVIIARIYKLFKNRNRFQQTTKGIKWQT